mmetsp:Transcript_4006/g.11340  ORF Transcript_4006/g.11340 Transcript_4006/m.11340 type:complete len:154 (-) Transcript_4006:2639-3100(-)
MVSNGNADQVRRILDRKRARDPDFDIDASKYWYGGNALHIASKYGRVDIVDILIEYGADMMNNNATENTVVNAKNTSSAGELLCRFPQQLHFLCCAPLAVQSLRFLIASFRIDQRGLPHVIFGLIASDTTDFVQQRAQPFISQRFEMNEAAFS